MRLVPVCAALAAFVFASSTARAQNDEPPPPAEERPQPNEPTAPAPTPPEWKLAYEEARAKLLTGELGDAAARFADLEKTAVNEIDRARAHEQATLAAEWSKKNLALVNRHDLREGGAAASAKADKRGTEELVLLYVNAVVYGIGSGAWLDVMTESKSALAALLPPTAMTGAAIGTVALLDTGRGFRYGVPQGIASGLWIGLEEGVVWTVWANSRKGETDLSGKHQATIIWGMSTAGAVAGGVLGSSLGTTPGRSSWVGSCALWTGAVFGFTMGAAVKKAEPPPAALAGAGVGLTLGTVVGIGSASSVSPSISRVRFIDLGGLGGGLVSSLIYVGAANDKADGRIASAITALGAVGGLAATYALTSSMAEDHVRTEEPAHSSAIASMRPLLMPADGGGMMGVGGVLQ